MTTTITLPEHLSEEWKTVPGTEGWYEVSNLGRLRSWRSISTKRLAEPRLLRPSVGKNGYRVWCHRLDGKEARLTVHRSVALAFYGEPGPGRWEVRHLDNDKLNNVVTNLCWGTPAENAADRVAAGTTNRGERSPFVKLTTEEVLAVRRLCHTVSPEDLARTYGVTPVTISRIIRRETWRHVA